MNIDIKKIVKTITRKNRGLQDPQLIYPARDWAIGMMGTLMIVCIALAFSVWQYQSYTNMSLDEEVVLTMIAYRTERVANALERYTDLADTHAEIISAVSSSPAIEEGDEEGVGDAEGDFGGDEETVEVPSLSM